MDVSAKAAKPMFGYGAKPMCKILKNLLSGVSWSIFTIFLMFKVTHSIQCFTKITINLRINVWKPFRTYLNFLFNSEFLTQEQMGKATCSGGDPC